MYANGVALIQNTENTAIKRRNKRHGRLICHSELKRAGFTVAVDHTRLSLHKLVLILSAFKIARNLASSSSRVLLTSV